MKFIKLIFNNIKRNPVRSLLTIGGAVVALFVFCTMLAIGDGLNTLARVSASKFLVVISDKDRSIPVMGRVPVAYANRITSLPGVVGVTPEQFYMSAYKKEGEQVVAIGIDPEVYRQFRDFEIIGGNYEDFQKEKKAALVGKEVAKKYNWKVGQEVVLKDRIFSFVIRGVISKPLSRLDEVVFVHLDYLQKVINREGAATRLIAKVSDPQRIDQISSEIDLMFANYPSHTRSQSESKDWEVFLKDVAPMVGFMSLIGFIAILVTLVGTINSISMSIRERTNEIGVLKAVGFENRQVLGLILVESVFLSSLGGLVGCGLAYGLLGTGNQIIDMGPQAVPLIVSPSIIITGIVISVLVGLIGGLLPAGGAVKLKIIDAIREVG